MGEALGTHVPLPPDGRHVFAVLIDELVEGPFEGADAIAQLLERCTAYDIAWDDEDEWNQQVLKVHGFLKDSPGMVSRIARAKERQFGDVADSLWTVLKRLAGDKTAEAAA